MQKPGKNWKPVPHAVARHPHLSAAAFRLWCVLRSHENIKGECEIKNETACREANLNIRTVQRAKKDLTALGLLTVLYQPRGKGKGSCRYRTNSGEFLGCHKRTSKETLYPQSIPSREWLEKMDRKHDCNGCGFCSQCRQRDTRHPASH